MINTNGNPGTISIRFGQGHYCIKAEYNNDQDFSNPLKWEKGGRRNYGQWWQFFAEPYHNIEEDKLFEVFSSDKELQKYIISNLDELKNIETRYHRTIGWKNRVGSYKNWKIFIWYWDMLACEFSSIEEGKPYMDIIENEKGNTIIQLANRKEDNELLNNTLKRIGCNDKIKADNGYVILEEVQSTDAVIVSERIKYWIEKINC